MLIMGIILLPSGFLYLFILILFVSVEYDPEEMRYNISLYLIYIYNVTFKSRLKHISTILYHKKLKNN